MSLMFYRNLLSTAVALTLFACGGPSQQIRARAPWDPELAPFFDDAVDFISNPGDLEGTWSSSYASELRARSDSADLVCRAHVDTVREDIGVDGERRKHLLARVTSGLFGAIPADERLHLVVDEGSAGFDTVDQSTNRILNNVFVVFVRWYEDENGQLRSHWHLSPGSRAVVQSTRRALEERNRATPPPRSEI